jgi:hypothetical protein
VIYSGNYRAILVLDVIQIPAAQFTLFRTR